MAESAPWQVVCERDALSARRALRTGRSVCLAHQREAVEADGGASLVACDKDARVWGVAPYAFGQNKRAWKKVMKPKFERRVYEVKKALVKDAGHDAAYGRGAGAVAAATRVGVPGTEVAYWAKVLPSAVVRQAMVRFKLGMIPGIKANVYKWGGQLARFDLGDAKRLMACPCGFGDGSAPQDPYHVAFECAAARPFWEAAVLDMDVRVQKEDAAVKALWASFSMKEKCKWGLSATDSPFPATVAADLHKCMGAAVAKLMAKASALFVTPALRSLELPYFCPPVPTVLQSGVVLMTRPPRGAVPDPSAVRVLLWPAEDCPMVPGVL